ncbi:MAG: MFS transporter [Deltaproteobacteria bacterium]|jgi:sugar phosphate permease|nr:MFS transporter [Deltaproteobacteria bacterium]
MVNNKRFLFWGWYVVLGAFLVLAVNYGVRYSFGIFLKPMAEEYGWSRAVISLGASFNMLVYSVCSIFVGKMVDRIPPRRIIVAGALMASLSLGFVAFATTPLAFYLTYGLLAGIGSAGLGVVVCNSSVAKWFHKRRGTAVGLATMGISAGTVALTPLAGHIVKMYDWKTGFLCFSLITFLIGVALAFLFFQKTVPEAYGWHPDGEKRARGGTETAWEDLPRQLSRRVVLCDIQFWLLSACLSLSYLAIMSVFVHQVPYALDHGIGKVAAASSLATVSFSAFFGQFFFGWLSDRIRDAKYAAVLGFFMMTCGMGFLLIAQSLSLLYLFAVVFGFGYGCLAPLTPILIAERFGRHALGGVYGLVTFFIGLGGSIGPFLAGYMYDRFGAYRHVWLFNIVLLLVVTTAILVLKKKNQCMVPDSPSSR